MTLVPRSNRTLRRKLRGALSPSIAIATALCAAALGGGAYAQTAPATDATTDDTTSRSSTDVIIVTGTRVTGMAVEDSPAPIQVLPGEILKETGASDLMNALATQIPSFNANLDGDRLGFRLEIINGDDFAAGIDQIGDGLRGLADR